MRVFDGRKAIRRCASLVLVAWCGPLSQLRAQRDEYENPPINYSATQPNNLISQLESEMAAGKFALAGSDKERVAALLSRLGIAAESQLLVFSNTSFQRGLIRPEHPRALYFSENCYVGWVPGGLVEIVAVDARLGPVFYTFDPMAPGAANKRFVRDADCLRCHGGTFVRDIPGVFARSVFPDARGEPMLRFGSQVVDDHTPFADRWGGWYVTGNHGAELHRGNLVASEKKGELVFDAKQGANLNDLSRFFPTSRYLAPGSDIVALLVFEHQLGTQNAITHAAFSCRRMLTYQAGLQRDFKEPVTEELVYDSVKSVFDSEARSIVDALLFKDAAELPALSGDESFQRAFLARAVRTADGASLRDLELSGRLFRHRCSYLVYSEMFLALPAALKARIYDRLAKALKAADPDPRYRHLDTRERSRIAGILRETHPELRQRWEKTAGL